MGGDLQWNAMTATTETAMGVPQPVKLKTGICVREAVRYQRMYARRWTQMLKK